tara:strand:- start:3205 stop:4368 length:1164 start_codon:yes stop_codon:yes gene_type:complete
MNIFNLPDLGEGLPDAEIREWHVKEGDTISIDEPLVSMETAKAVVDVPSPLNGKIVKLYGGPGDIIETGNPLVEFSIEENSPTNISNQPSKKTKIKDQGTVVGNIDVGDTIEDEATSITSNSNKKNNKTSNIKATPAVRALAKKLDVDLSQVIPTGSNNTITASDINKAAAIQNEIGESTKIQGSKRAMLSIMTSSHAEVAPATIMDDADVGDWNNDQDITARLARSVIYACKQEPILNSWFDSQNQSIRTSDTVNLGLAVDSKEGLFVPVIKNAEKLDLKQIRSEINIIKEEVTSRTIDKDKLHGNTITLSNIGSIAVKYASPIIVPPTVAIVATGRIHDAVLAINNEMKIRKIIPISLTFDHRCVTGGEAGRFLAAMIEDLNKEI